MIAGIFHKGSGLGDQLFRYITIRTLAEEKGYDWTMGGWDYFKGSDFLNLERGDLMLLVENAQRWNEKVVRQHQDFPNESIDVRSYDPEINFVEDNTIIDGSFEDSKYWHHNLENINKWLAVEPLEVPDDLCVLGFRGGEYYTDPNLGLPKEYFQEAMAKMLAINPNMKFEVHTEDVKLASEFFPLLKIIDNKFISHSQHENMGLNWRTARHAKYAIIPNSAFFIIPRLLKHLEDPEAITIAPRYWARRNTKIWARPACYYKEFTYV